MSEVRIQRVTENGVKYIVVLANGVEVLREKATKRNAACVAGVVMFISEESEKADEWWLTMLSANEEAVYRRAVLDAEKFNKCPEAWYRIEWDRNEEGRLCNKRVYPCQREYYPVMIEEVA